MLLETVMWAVRDGDIIVRVDDVGDGDLDGGLALTAGNVGLKPDKCCCNAFADELLVGNGSAE